MFSALKKHIVNVCMHADVCVHVCVCTQYICMGGGNKVRWLVRRSLKGSMRTRDSALVDPEGSYSVFQEYLRQTVRKVP